MIQYIPYLYERCGSYSWRADNEITMARVNDFILHCVIYLFPSIDDAKQTKNIGGSGFVVGVKSKVDDKFCYLYAVTNAHVVNGATVIRINNRSGGFDFIEKKDKDWIRHPDGDDLAITYIEDDIKKHHQVDFFIPDDMFADTEAIKEHDIGIGEEVFIAGRFQLAQGKLQNTPTLRFGNIAQMPIEPIKSPTGVEQESYLVECHSISGFSGSPVFIYIPAFTPRPNSTVVTGTSHTLLLGVDWGHLPIREHVESKNEQTDEWEKDCKLRVINNSAMMGVVPVWKLQELLDQPKLMKIREELDKKRGKEKKPVSKEETIQHDDLTLTEEEFKDALKKVSQKIKPSEPDSSKPKT